MGLTAISYTLFFKLKGSFLDIDNYSLKVFYSHRNMGGGGSKHQDAKTVDTSGTVNNNVVFTEPVPIHHETLEWLILVICIVKVIELAITIYKIHQKQLKKKYGNNAA